MSITDEHIKRLTIPELIRSLSLGAWIFIIGLVVGAFCLGYNVRDWMPSTDRKELSDGQLTGEEMSLVIEIWRYQKTNNLNKVIVGRDGYIYEEGGKKTDVNLAFKVLGIRGVELRFEQLITSISADFLKFIPETRFGSPYVVTIPERSRDFLNKKL